MNLHRNLTSLLTLLVIMLAGLPVYGQTGTVSIAVKNATLRKVFTIIEKQTTYRFSYQAEIIDNKPNITLRHRHATVGTVLNEALRGRNLTYDIVTPKSIVISRKVATVRAAQHGSATRTTDKVTGTVTDKDGEPIIGATVQVRGTDIKTVTNIDGEFTLDAPEGSDIVVSYVGFKDFVSKARDNMRVSLAEDTQALDEIVVVGYGTMKKSDLTGAITSVDATDLAKRTTTNPAEALEGKVAGVSILKSGGNAGAGFSVKIRGIKTFGDNEPLYIIDGFPGNIDNVNPQDIETMEILKDGAAAAIYGSVAANGVIIVTTKNGKKGDMKIDFTTYLSFTHIAKKLDMLNAAEYKQVHKQMYDNYNAQFPADAVTLPAYITHDTGVDTDWQKAVERSGLSQNYMVSVRGGTDKGQYAVSYNHANDKGIFRGNSFRQDNARAKLHATRGFLDFDANMNFRFTESHQPQYSIKEMYMISPLVPIYNDKEKYGFGLTNFDGLPNNRNIMADDYYKKGRSRGYDFNGNVGLTFHITPWLSFKTSYAYRGVHGRTNYHSPDYIADAKVPVLYPNSSAGSTYWENHVFDNVLNFNKQFGSHSVNVMLGSSIDAKKYEWDDVAVEGKTIVYRVENGKLVQSEQPAGFLSSDFPTVDAGEGGTYSGDGSYWRYNRASFFGRLNYNYANRYLMQFTLRRDGSSKFGSERRWGTFPSVALGWRISEEPFFPKDTPVSNLKLRASWGRLGNENALGYYSFLALISTSNTMYQGYVRGSGSTAWPGSIARGLENRDLKWETTDTKNIGVDFGLFNNRLSGNINYYYNETSDLLIYKELAPSVGLSSPILNVGKMRNTGIEIELNWNDHVGDFSYTVGANLSTVSNKVKALSDANQVLYGQGLKYGSEHFPTQTRVGKPIGAFYLYQARGIFQSDEEAAAYVNARGERLQPNAKAGDIRFKDMNGDGVINDDDKVYSGSGIPKVEANLNFSCAWKGFDMNFTLSGAFDYKLYNGNRYFYESMSSGSNFLKSTLNAWTTANHNTDVPRAVYQDPNNNSRESTRFLENGDFLRMREIQVGYTLPKWKAFRNTVEKVRFYVSADNLFTITGYDGIDPEFSRGVLNTGVDNLIYPFTRSYTIGAQITF